MGAKPLRVISLVLIGLLARASSPAWAQKRVLTLQQAIDEGLQNNLNYKIEQLNYETNLLNIKQAQGARLPTLNLTGTDGYSFGRSLDPSTNQFVNQHINSNNVAANLNFPLFAGFQVWNNVQRFKASARVKTYQNQKLKNDLTLNIINGYLAVVTNRLVYNNTQTRISQSKQQLAIIQKQFDAGRVAHSELDRYNAQILTEQLNLAQSNQTLQGSLVSLKYLVLKDTEEDIDVEIPTNIEPDSTILAMTGRQVQEEALARLPEIKAATEQVVAQTYGERVARGALYPTLSFNAQMYSNYSSARKKVVNVPTTSNTVDLPTKHGDTLTLPAALFGNFTNSSYTTDYARKDQLRDNISQVVSLQLSIPILNGLRARTTLNNAKVARHVAELTLEQQKRTTSQEIRNAYQTAQTNKIRYDLAKRQVEAQRAVYNNALARFNAGRATSFETTTEQTNLTVAENDLLTITINYLYSIKLLEFYTGRL